MHTYKGEVISCDLCGSSIDSHNQLYEIIGYRIVQCENCSLVFVNPIPTEEELDDFYQSYFHSEEWYNLFPQLKNFRYLKKTESDKESFKSYIDSISKYKTNGKLLDIGCGDGYLLYYAQQAGYDVFGIEPARIAYEIAKELIGEKRVKISRFSDLEIENNSYDIITLIGVIEHIRHPSNVFKKLYNILSPNGLLILQTPNIDSYQYRVQKKKWEQFTPPGHLYYFSPKTIRMYLKKAGFKILKIDMRAPLFAPLNYGSLTTIGSDGKSGDNDAKVGAKNVILPLLKPVKPILIPIYNVLCQLRGKILGKHDITVYAKKI